MKKKILTRTIHMIMWNKDSVEDVAAADKKFGDYLRQGWIAYIEQAGEQKKMIFDFDPSVEEIFFYSPVHGG